MARKKKCTKCRIGSTKRRTSRKVTVDPMQLGLGVAAATGGLMVANKLSAEAKKYAAKKGKDYNGNLSGALKIAAGLGLAYAGVKYAKKYQFEMMAASIGAGMSGAIDLVTENAPDFASDYLALGEVAPSSVGVLPISAQYWAEKNKQPVYGNKINW